MTRHLLLIAAIAILGSSARSQPNVLYILADDLGYGSVSALNGATDLRTPNIDRLAAEGMSFTDAHACSSVCSPSRYGILTGRYGWRSHLKKGVLRAFDRPLIEPARLTVAKMFQEKGYHTACIGKWHLGWVWPKADGTWDLSLPIGQGPITRGFDSYFGEDVSHYPPYCFIENDRVVGPLDQDMRAVDWDPTEVTERVTDRAVAYLEERARSNSEPFFLFFAPDAIHRPAVPSAAFERKSQMNPYADFVLELDACVGRLLETLDRTNLARDTLVIFTSDNGPEGFKGRLRQFRRHHAVPNGPLRGVKGDAWEGGHRVPFLVRWPAAVAAGKRSSQLVSLTDFMATAASILDYELPGEAAEDSFDITPAMLGGNMPVRRTMILHSWSGAFAIRKDQWKLILCADSGGFGALGNTRAAKAGLYLSQLYDLDDDLGESANLVMKRPGVAKELRQLLQQQRSSRRTAPRR